MNLMLQCAYTDAREAAYKNVARDLRDRNRYLPVLQWIADRLEGRPSQTVNVRERRVTIFEPAPAATPEAARAPGATPGTPTKSIAGGSEPMPYVLPRPEDFFSVEEADSKAACCGPIRCYRRARSVSLSDCTARV